MKYKKPQLPGGSLYPEHGLNFNPFRSIDTMVKDDSEQAAYVNRIYNREAQRVMFELKERVISGEASKFWIVKDMRVDPAHHVYFSGALLRAMKNGDSFRIFPTVALLSLIYKRFADGVQRAILDRLDEQSFELCLFSYIYSALEKLVDSASAEQALPEVDVPALLREIEESDGEILRKILYPEVEDESAEERDGDDAPEARDVDAKSHAGEGGDSAKVADEGADAEEKGANAANADLDILADVRKEAEATADLDEATAEAEDEENRRLRALGDAIYRAVSIDLESSPFGHLGREAVSRGLIALDEGLRFLKAGGAPPESLVDVLRFLTFYYHVPFVIVDRIDVWEMLDDEERKRVYAEVSEWKWVIGDKGCLAIHAGPRFAEVTDESFLADAAKVHIDFHDLERDATERLDAASAAELIADFLSAARPAGEERSIRPFTEGAIKMMVERSEGDAVAIIDLAAKLIESSDERGLGVIDEDAVAESTG